MEYLLMNETLGPNVSSFDSPSEAFLAPGDELFEYELSAPKSEQTLETYDAQ